MRYKKSLAALVAGIAIVWGGSAIWRAGRALETAEREQRDATSFRFEERALARTSAKVEYLGAPSGFRDAAVFRDRIYICGSAGLFAYDADGRLVERYRVGEHLPPAPLVAMAAAGPTLWIATSGEGLLAFDGRAFRHIRPAFPEHRKLTSLATLPTGRLLLGTEKAGVLAFDGSTLGGFHASLQGMHVTALVADDTAVWVGTISRGALQWNAGHVREYKLPDQRVLSLAVHDGAAYIGTALGVAVVRNERIQRTAADGLFARALHVDKGRLLVGTQEDGVYAFPRRTRASESAGTIEKFLELRGATYALTSDALYDVRNWDRVVSPEPATLADSNIAALAAGADGRVWIGYFDRGLDILEATTAKHLEDEHLFCVNRILHAPDHGGWAVATANGLVLLDEHASKRQVVTRAQGLIANHVTDVAIAGDTLLLATPAGLTFAGKDGPRSLYAFHGLVNNHVYALAAANGKVLAGTLGGLSILEGGYVRASYTTANSPLRHNWITAIAAQGRDFFIGTYGSGVYRLSSDGSWNSHQDAIINPGALFATPTRVYAGSLGGGLLIYDGERWRTWTAGLPSSNVTAVTAAGGYLYIGTDNGLVRIKEADL